MSGLAPLVIRELTPADEAAAIAVLTRALESEVPHIKTVAAEKLFGDGPPPAKTHRLGAWRGDELVGVAVLSGRWLRVGGVVPEARSSGVGTALLDEVVRLARAAGETRVRAGDQPGNYLAPGVDTRLRPTVRWLERRSFMRSGMNEDLVVPLAGNQLVTPARVIAAVDRAVQNGCTIRRATPADADALDDFVRRSFSPAWAFEAGRALEAAPGGVYIATLGDVIIGFSAHDGNNRGLGWFGPSGTLDQHRGKGVGQALLLSCLAELADAGHQDAVIAWIGPRNFYERTAGAGQGHQYLVLERPI